ncbi:small multi-drug export protein [Virgibacillus sp. NKC19-16]|uniref:small multi-drug export protein n=1 Tax=Virgibacillus salidurans TaxID=2831673 RepID=UPI001F38A162|nr:small multi-drug export protein [Virgibacillus sp. NKC19-16]UJL46233.1 small multi-drug export protein [Virgibacillus sp. NKC19-16]
MLFEYVLVFIAAAIPWFEIAVVIPLGIVRGLSPFWVMLLAFVGNVITVLPVVFGADKIMEWYAKRREKKGKESSNRNDRGRRIWNKYGLPGLALLGPIVTGIHLAALIAMTLGAQKTSATIWLTISLGIWTLVLGIGTILGLDIFL